MRNSGPRVRDQELLRIRGTRPDDLTTYERILLARENIMKLQRDDFMASKPLLDAVIAAEPGWGEAFALAADWHGLLVGQGWSVDRAADIAEVERLSREALSLDASNVRALVSYGHRKSLLYRDYDTALSLFDRALDAAPSSAQAWLRSSYTVAYLGQAREAVQRAMRAMELSPLDREAHVFFDALCVAHYTAGDYEAAADWGLRAHGEPKVLHSTSGWTAAALAALGRTDKARDIADLLMARLPDRRVRDVVAQHPYQDPGRRQRYGQHLLAAGCPA